MILAILQARFSSSRLPGKVLKPILGKPMLLHQLERLKHSRKIEKLIVATSIEVSDDPIEKMCVKNNIEVFRGNLDNVLDRFYQCAKSYNPEHVVRLTGDCPLIDCEIVDQVIQYHLDRKSTYTSNCKPPTFPDGLDVEVFKFSILEEAWKFAKLPSELEHVTPYIRKNLELSDKSNFEFEEDLSMHRWTVDELNDFKIVERVYSELYPKDKRFNMQNILDLLKKLRNLSEINNYIMRNEGSLKSCNADEEFLKNEL